MLIIFLLNCCWGWCGCCLSRTSLFGRLFIWWAPVCMAHTNYSWDERSIWCNWSCFECTEKMQLNGLHSVGIIRHQFPGRVVTAQAAIDPCWQQLAIFLWLIRKRKKESKVGTKYMRMRWWWWWTKFLSIFFYWRNKGIKKCLPTACLVTVTRLRLFTNWNIKAPSTAFWFAILIGKFLIMKKIND